MVHGQDGVSRCQACRGEKGVCWQRSHQIQSFIAQFIQSGIDDFDLFAAEVSTFAGMRVESGHQNSRSIQPKTLLQVMLQFYHHESCGQCTPCRDGMGWLHRIIDRIVAGTGVPEDLDRMRAIARANDGTTICGMGDAAGYATVAMLDKFGDEFEYCIAHGRSRLDGRLEVGHA